MKIGQKVRKKLTGLIQFERGRNVVVPPSWGTVAWIHPKGRFYLAEFRMGNSVIHECFREGE